MGACEQEVESAIPAADEAAKRLRAQVQSLSPALVQPAAAERFREELDRACRQLRELEQRTAAAKCVPREQILIIFQLLVLVFMLFVLVRVNHIRIHYITLQYECTQMCI